MSTFRDVVARMAVDPEFARHARAHPEHVARTYRLTDDEAGKLRGLADAQAGTGPMALGARLSKSGIGAGALSPLADLAGGVEVTPMPVLAPTDPPDLEGALNDLYDVGDDAPDEPFKVPSSSFLPPEHIQPADSPDAGPIMKIPPGDFFTPEPMQPPDDGGVLEAVPFEPAPEGPADQGQAPADVPSEPGSPSGAVLPPDTVLPADPFVMEASDAWVSQSGEHTADADQPASPAQAGPAVPGAAVVMTPAEDDLGAEELAIGAAGLAAGAVAGGVAGVVAGKAIAAQQNDKPAS